ncbi:MAG: DUF359 domain-containing protein [Thermofilum sp.]
MAYPWGYVVFEDPPESVRFAAELIGDSIVVTVGDVVSWNFAEYFRSDLMVIDRRSRRVATERHPSLSVRIYTCENPPSTLSSECWEALSRALSDVNRGLRAAVLVNGEEDLLAIPAIILCPKGGWVVYGNWKGFLCLIPCTPLFKRIASTLLESFFEKEGADERDIAP